MKVILEAFLFLCLFLILDFAGIQLSVDDNVDVIKGLLGVVFLMFAGACMYRMIIILCF